MVRFILGGLAALALAGAFYLILPVLGLEYASFWMGLWLWSSLGLALFGFWAAQLEPSEAWKARLGISDRGHYGQSSLDQMIEKVTARVAMVSGGSLLLLLSVAFVTSSGMLHADRYAAVIGDMTAQSSSAVEAALPALALERAPLVTEEMAQRAAEAKLGGDDPALGSIVEVGRMHRQLVDGNLVWVGYLQHRGFFSWMKSGTTPGYIVVNATDVQDVRIVRELGGEPLKLRHLPSAFFSDDLKRKAYFNGTMVDKFGEPIAELDDQGRPFYIIPLLKPSVGFGGMVVGALLVVDAQTGEIRRYSRESIPAWIDRVEPERLVFQRIEDWGYYHSGGWLNPSQLGRLQTSTHELDLVSTAEGHGYWVSGLTSVGKDSSLTGLVLVDTRTGAVRRFTLSGVVEEQAIAIVEQAFRAQGYRATNPTPLLVEGIPTYVASVVDDAGATKGYALIAIQNREVVATADTLRAAVRLYQGRMSRDRSGSEVSAEAEAAVLTGRVVRRGEAVKEGTTLVYLTLDVEPEKIFSASVDISDELVLTNTGDTVEVRFLAGPETGVVDLRSFDNQAIGTGSAKN